MSIPLKKAIIICGGNQSPRTLESFVADRSALVIAADSGADYAFKEGITPAVIIGDLDSISPEALRLAQSQDVKILRYNHDKDATDLELAVDYALSQNANEITLTCSLGKRIDYTLGNLLLLAQERFAGIRLSVQEDGAFGRILRKGEAINIPGNPGDTLSIVPLSPIVAGVIARGVQWELENATLNFGSSYSLSNKFIGSQAFVEIGDGTALVFHLEKAAA